MQYDRFLDVHLVTSRPQDLTKYANDPDKLAAKKAAQQLGPYRQGAYQCDFHRDVLEQQSAYSKNPSRPFAVRPEGAVSPSFAALTLRMSLATILHLRRPAHPSTDFKIINTFRASSTSRR